MAHGSTLSEAETQAHYTPEERAAVIAEMEAVLADPIFKSSNRCVTMLRYLVERALNHEEGIKERLLGMEVFGRPADYDVATDPIVRRVAGEIRKKLAQCYQESGDHRLVTIHLARGGYLAEFEFANRRSQEQMELLPLPERSANPVGSSDVHRETPESVLPSPRRRILVAVAAIALVGMIGIAFSLGGPFFMPSQDRIWRPLVDSSDSVIVVLPARVRIEGSRPTTASDGSSTDGSGAAGFSGAGPSSLFRDVYVGTGLASKLSSLKRTANVRMGSSLTLSDFQRAPAILIGGSNNPWISVFLSDLRFTVQIDPVTGETWIRDAWNPKGRDWRISGGPQSQPPAEDYAVVTRVFNQQTSQWMLALSGLAASGTQAAADLLDDPKFAKLIPKDVGAKGNFQLVLETSLINGEPGSRRVVAVHTW